MRTATGKAKMYLSGALIVAACGGALTPGAVSAKPEGGSQIPNAQDAKVNLTAPTQRSLSQKRLSVSVTCLASPGTDDMCRSVLRISYRDGNGEVLRVPPASTSAICHPGSNHERRCWVARGETTTYSRRLAPGGVKLVRKALSEGPVWMMITAEVQTKAGGTGAETAKVRITR